MKGRRVFREVPLLMKVGLIMMAPAVLIGAVVLSVPLRSDSERLVAAEVATNSPGQGQRSSSGQEGRATKNSSSEKGFPRSFSGEQEKKESLRYGSSSSGGTVEQRKEDAKEPQALPQKEEAERSNSQAATPQVAGGQTPSEAPSWVQSQPHFSSTNPTNKSNRCRALRGGAGPSPPKES